MKKQSLVVLVIALLILSVISVQCAGPEATPTPPEAPAPAEPTQAPTEEPTEAPVEEPTEEPTEEPSGPTGTLVIGLSSDINVLDKPNGTTEFMNTVARYIQQHPFDLNPDGSFRPLLAESYEVIDDTHIRFFLRQDVQFTNGEPFNAQVFDFSWKWVTGNEVRNTEVWGNVETVEIEDDYTVVIAFNKLDPVILQKLAYDYPLYPPQYTEEVGMDGFGQAPIGTGPFILEEWVPGDRVVLRANPDYYEPGRPKVGTIIFRPIPEDSTRAAALQAGDIDIARLLPVELVPQLESDPNITVVKALGTRTYSIFFNNMTTGKGTPIENALVRQALNYAVDNDQIVEAILDGYGVALDSFVGPQMFGYDPSVPPIPYDPDKAKELLTEAGYPDGFEVSMACPAGAYVKVEEVCQAVAGYLEDAGITVDLQIMESGLFWDQEAGRTIAPLFFDGWGSRLLDPTGQILGAFVPNTVRDYGSEWANFEDSTYTELWEAQGLTVDPQVRSEVLAEFQRYMQENPGALYLYQMFMFEGVHNRVHDYGLLGSETQILYDTYVED